MLTGLLRMEGVVSNNFTTMKHRYGDMYLIRDTGIPRYDIFPKKEIRGII
jgi:hypothetical protein